MNNRHIKRIFELRQTYESRSCLFLHSWWKRIESATRTRKVPFQLHLVLPGGSFLFVHVSTFLSTTEKEVGPGWMLEIYEPTSPSPATMGYLRTQLSRIQDIVNVSFCAIVTSYAYNQSVETMVLLSRILCVSLQYFPRKQPELSAVFRRAAGQRKH